MNTAVTSAKGKAIPATARGGQQGCETPRLRRLTDGGEIVSLKRWSAALISVAG
jgi:hypothetical protein